MKRPVDQPAKVDEEPDMRYTAVTFCPPQRTRDKKHGMSIERRFIDNGSLADGYPEHMSRDQVFEALEPYTTIPPEGSRSIRAIQEQFQGTPIADIFLDFPENQSIYTSDLYHKLHTYFTGSLSRSVLVTADEEIFTPRLQTEETEDFRLWQTHEEPPPGWQAAAAAVQETITALVPGMKDSRRDFDIVFTPRIKNGRQLILAEHAHTMVPSLLVQGSSEYTKYTKQQYRVFEQNTEDRWLQRGTLTFLDVAAYDKDPDPEEAEYPFLETRVSVALLDRPYPTQDFNWHRFADVVLGKIGRTIISPLPPGIAVPEFSDY